MPTSTTTRSSRFPTGTNRLYGFAEYLYVSSKSQNPDLAAKFLDYFTSDAVQQETVGMFATTSPNKNVKYENLPADQPGSGSRCSRPTPRST